MEKEIRDFIKRIENGKASKKIQADEDFMKLISLLKKNDGQCPQCGRSPIVLGLLKHEKILICTHCEEERRYGSNKISLSQLRERQLNNLALEAETA